MKTKSVLLIAAFCVTFIGCGMIYGPVEEAKALINEKEAVILEMGKKIEASPNEVGVDEARKIFEARKDGLKAKAKAISQKSKGFNSDWQTMLFESRVTDGKYFDAIRSKSKLVLNEAADKKFSDLQKDFKEATNW